VDKVAEWQLEAELQEKIFYDLHGSSYNDKWSPSGYVGGGRACYV
jgi:hypothetical protein